MQRALTFLLLLGLARSLSFQAAQDSTIYDRRRLYSSGKVLNLRSLQKMRVTVTLTRDTADTFTTEKQAALLAAFKAKNIYKLHQDQDGGEFPPRSDVIERKITAISTLNGNEVVRCSRPRGKYPCLLWNSQAKESGLKIYFELSASRPVMHFILSAIENGEMAVWLRDQLISVDGLNEYVSFSIPAVSDTAYPNVKMKPLPIKGTQGIDFGSWEMEDWAIVIGMICLGFAAFARIKSRSRESLYELAARRERRWEERRHADTQTTRRKDVEMSALAHAFTLREHQDLEMEGSEIRRRCSDGGDLVI